MNFDEKLKQILKQNIELVDNETDDLARNEIINRAYKVDKDLIGILIKDKRIRETFFDKIKEYWVFNVNKFVDYIENIKVLSNSYTKFKNVVGLNVNGKYLNERGEVSLVWPFKDCVLEGGMTKEDQERNEIFFNEILAKDEIDRLFDAKVLTNFKKYTTKGEEKVKDFNRDEKGTIKDNLIIKGNNLLALHSLKKEFAGKVKLIYIDPPFNTGNDEFNYNDNFLHSTWLTFMKNRLEAAKDLLLDSGGIFVNLDDIELHYCKILMDEIFGRERFVATIAVKSSTPSGPKTAHKDKKLIKQKDLILFYKNGRSINLKPQYYARTSWDGHYSYWLDKEKNKFVLRKLIDILIKNKIVIEGTKLSEVDINNKKFKDFYLKHSDNIVRIQTHKNKVIGEKSKKLGKNVYVHEENGKILGLYYDGGVITPLKQGLKTVYYNQKFVEDLGLLVCDFWQDVDFQNTQNEGGVSFPTAKKPEFLIHRIIDLVTKEGDIILDYHLGSGTTCAVAHKMGRRYIGIEQLDYGKDDSIKRMKNVIKGDQSGISKAMNWKGGGEFISCELLKYNENAIDKIQDAKDTKSLLKIWDEMCEHYFLNYDVEIKKFNDNKKDFEKLTLKQQKDTLVEMLNKNQLYVNLSEIEDSQFKVSKEDKELNKKFYGEK